MRQVMFRRIAGLLGLAILGAVPLACGADGGGAGGGGSGGTGGAAGANVQVGLACAPPSERSPQFTGYDLNEDVLIVGAPECGQGVCLVNHFQGAVACPLGQSRPVDAQGLAGCDPEHDAQGNWVSGQGSCKPGDVCAQAGSFSPPCSLDQGQAPADQYCASLGAGNHCAPSGVCECQTNADCLFVTEAVVACDPQIRQCVAYACHAPGSCQVAGATDAENAGKACCVPGTDIPYTRSVCGQCEGSAGQATRDAESAVYCSCRCGVADGDPDDPDYPFCACPDGFECSEIRKNVGLGPQEMTGKYCIKAGTAFDRNADQCGGVDGHWDSSCKGAATGDCQPGGGPCN